MSRLPIVDGDAGNWGTVLNDFLEVSHNADGTLQSSAIKQAGAVTSVNTIAPVSNGNVTLTPANIGAGTYSKPSGGIPASDLSSSAQSNLTAASTAVQSVNGKTGTSVMLSASDVNAPTSLAGDSDVSISSPSNNQVLTYDSSSSKWKNQNSSSAPVTSVAGKTGAVTLVEADITNLTTDLAATEKTANKGAASGYAPLNSSSQVPIANIPTGTSGATAALGNDSRITGAIQSGATAGGDLSGTLPSPTVAKVQGISVSSTAPIGPGQVLTSTSTSAAAWSTPSGNATSIDGVSVSGTPSSGQVIIATNGTTASWSALPSATTSALGVVELTGDLAGTATSPSVAKIKGITLPSSDPTTAGQVLTSTSTSATAWQTPASNSVSSVFGRTGAVVAASGDYTAAQVTNAADKSSVSTQTFASKVTIPALQVTGGTPASGAVLTADSSGNATWQTASSGGVATPAGAGVFNMLGSVSGYYTRYNSLQSDGVNVVNGNPVSAGENALCGNPWDYVQTSGGMTYSNVQTFNNELLSIYQNSNGNSYNDVGWNYSGSSADIYSRMYIYFTNIPNSTIMMTHATTGNAAGAVTTLSISYLASKNQLTISISAGSTNGVRAYGLVTGVWYRIELHTHISATAGYGEFKLFSAAGALLDYAGTANSPLHSGNATCNTSAAASFVFGDVGGYGSQSYLADLGACDLGWIGV